MKPLIIKISLALLFFGLGWGVCKYTAPQKIIMVEKEKQVEKRDVITKTVKVKNPDGSSTTTRITEDKTVIDSEKNKSSVIKNDKPNLKVDALIGYNLKDKDYAYGIQIQKRFSGPVFIGGWGVFSKSPTAGLSIGIEF